MADGFKSVVTEIVKLNKSVGDWQKILTTAIKDGALHY